MGSKSVPAVVRQLLLLTLAVVGAEAAWRSGFLASFVLCCLVAVWAAAQLLAGGLARRAGDSASDQRWRSAIHAREREARVLAAYLDHAPVPLLTLAGDGRLTALNLAARRFFATDDLVRDPSEHLLTAIRSAAPGERRTVTLDSEAAPPRAYALTTAEVVSDSDYVRIAALVDIQAEIQAAEAATLRDLIQVLSHEIMNSLSPVTSLAHTASDLLSTPEPDPVAFGKAREAVEGVARRSEGLLRFIEAYRELARMPEPRFAETDLRVLLEDVALLFRSRWAAKGVVLDLEAPGLTASLDRDLITQALLNVLGNAAEAALEGAAQPRVSLTCRRGAQGRPVIAVADNGPGLNLPDTSVIFRPFFTTKPTGTGVGLSVARQAVILHGGDIVARNDPSGGAVVTLHL